MGSVLTAELRIASDPAVPFEAECDQALNGGSQPGVPVWKTFSFAYNTPGLNAGIPIGYTPAIGEAVIDAAIQVTQMFDGTTPLGDFGQFFTGDFGFGLFGNLATAVDMTSNDDQVGSYYYGFKPAGSLAQLITAGAVYRASPSGIFLTAHPLKVVVSQDGTAGGTAVGGTQGTATLWLQTAVPVAL